MDLALGCSARRLVFLAAAVALLAQLGCSSADPAFVQRVRVDRAATAEECPGGGAILDLWAEKDGDGVPDGDELTARVTSCSDGAVGGGLIVRSEYVPPGDDCEAGGARVVAGYDDGDAVLAPDEVDDEQLDCALASVAVTGVAHEAAGEDGFSNLFLVDVADGSIRHLTTSGSATVSLSRPVTSGDLVLYLRKPDVGEAREPYLHRISTGVDTRLHVTDGVGNVFQCGFGDAGTIWVHGSGIGGWSGEAIWSVDPSTGAVTRLSGDGLVMIREAGGVAGTPVVFTGRYDYTGGSADDAGLHVPGAAQALLALPTSNDTWIPTVDVSPYGVAFAGTLDGGPDDVWIQPLSGGAAVKVTANDGSFGYGPVEWAGDKLIFGRSSAGDGTRLFLYDPPAVGEDALAPVELTDSGRKWVIDSIEGRDGSVVFVGGDDSVGYCQDVYLYDIGSGATTRVTRTGDACENYVLE